MKNKVLILLFAIGGLMSSCSDAYDIPEKGVIYDEYEAFRKAQDVERGLNVIYASIPSTTEISLGSIFTDEVAIGLNNGGQGLINGQYGFLMETNNGYAASLWGSYYTMINRINRLEVISKKLMAENAAEANAHKNNLAELYVLRAYAHYKLFAYFTPNYTNESGMSAIILDHVPPLDYSYSLPRNTVKQVKDFILADLVRAEENRVTGWRAGVDYVNSGVINSIRVKLFSMTEQWDDVLTYGELVMNQFPISDSKQYADLFSKEPPVTPGSEIIFRSKVTPNSGPSVVATWYSVRAQRNNGSFFYEMGRSLYNEFDKLDAARTGTLYNGQTMQGLPNGQSRDDVRYNVNLLGVVGNSPNGTEVLPNYETASQSDYNSKDVLLIGKYPGISGADLKNDIYLFRTADILLAMAEARAAKGQLSDGSTDPDDLIGKRTNVYSIIYTLRAARWVPAKATPPSFTGISMPSITSQQSAFNAILNERRVEFAFEGHRYLDMKRLGVKAGSPGFTRYSKDCAVNGACNLPANDHRMTLPIPVGEMNGNNSLTTDSQNPGY